MKNEIKNFKTFRETSMIKLFKKSASVFILTGILLLSSQACKSEPKPGAYVSLKGGSILIVHTNKTLSGAWHRKSGDLMTYTAHPWTSLLHLKEHNDYAYTNECRENDCGKDIDPIGILQIVENGSGFIVKSRKEDWTETYKPLFSESESKSKKAA